MKPKAVLMNTYWRNEKYIDLCIEIMDILWENHPEIWVITDKGVFRYPKKICIPSQNWVLRMKNGIETLIEKKILSSQDYILLIGEDHVCIQKVPDAVLERLLSFAASNDISFLSLTGFEPRHEIAYQDADIVMYEKRSEATYYSETHPAFWKVAHFQELLSGAMKNNIEDIWEFEKFRPTGCAKHFTAYFKHNAYVRPTPYDFIWPTPYSGFLTQNKVSVRALPMMRDPALRKLKSRLILELILHPERLVKHIGASLSKFFNPPKK